MPSPLWREDLKNLRETMERWPEKLTNEEKELITTIEGCWNATGKEPSVLDQEWLAELAAVQG